MIWRSGPPSLWPTTLALESFGRPSMNLNSNDMLRLDLVDHLQKLGLGDLTSFLILTI